MYTSGCFVVCADNSGTVTSSIVVNSTDYKSEYICVSMHSPLFVLLHSMYENGDQKLGTAVVSC